MPHDFGHSEEDHLGKPYDIHLLGRLLPFVKPYRLMLAASIVLVIVITLLDLSLPYLTKIAIDRHIVPMVTGHRAPSAGPGPQPSRWFAVKMSDPESSRIVAHHPSLFKVDGDGKQARIRYEDLNALPPEALSVLRRDDVAGIGRITALFGLLIVLHFALTFLQMMIMEYTGQMIMHDLRMRLFSHLLSLSVAFFSRNPVGRLVTRATNDIQNMHELFTSIIVFVFKDLFLLLGISAVLLSINWQLALVSFAVIPLVIWVSAYFSGQAREAFRTMRVKIAEINTRFSETIQGIRVIQLFGQEKANDGYFSRLNHDHYLAGMRQLHVFAVFMPVIELLGSVSVGLVIWYGGGRVLSGTLSLGALVAFISYMKMFFRPIRDIAEKYNVMQNAMASAERLFLLLDNRDRLPEPPPAPPGGATVEKASIHTVAFDRVTFSYGDNQPVLKDISFEIRSGETIAVVGPTGSGKTTLIHLLLRFYDPGTGRIALNGMDMKTVDMAAWRNRMALVMQEPFLFSATVGRNIFPSNGNTSPERIREILAAANCSDLIDRLPEGLETHIGEGGRSLSSGEGQLISIARALARDPDLIILDEATSYIDSETEEKIQGALQNLMAGRTAVVVAHRLSTARAADRIIVLNGGRIIESGTHETLIAQQGFYAGMVRFQM